MFAYYCPPLAGEPWLDIDDARLLDDFDWGTSAFIMAKRARRTQAEVLQRLEHLGRPLATQPTGRKLRGATWSL